MFYYKLPVVDGVTDCSAGSILLCAYPQGNYMVCKFESVANVGPEWVEITAEEFEANCPEFPADIPVNPVRVTEDGYTEIDGLRQMVSGKMIVEGNTVRFPTQWDGGVTHEEVITLDKNGLPVKIESDGKEIPFEMEGFNGGTVESEDHPGCYYRMVGAEKEWLNPPMVFGTEYRTAERFNGKPVYVIATKMEQLASSVGSASVVTYDDIVATEIVGISGKVNSYGKHYSFPAIVDGKTGIEADVWSNPLEVSAKPLVAEFTERPAIVTVKYTK